MHVFKQKLEKNQTLYFVLMAILVVSAIFIISFSSQTIRWLTPTILVVISIIATVITNLFVQVVKQKYKKNLEQGAASQLEQFLQMKETILNSHQQMLEEQRKQVQQVELKLQKVEETQKTRMKELQQTIELNKQLIIVKLTEQITQQFELLTNTAVSIFDDSKKQLEEIHAEIDTSFAKQLMHSTSLQKSIETMNSDLLEHSTKQHAHACDLVSQHALELAERVNEKTQQSIEQTTASEKLLTEILTTLARNILTASNMMKDSLSKQYAEALSHIDQIDSLQHKRTQQSFDALTERVLYVTDQLHSNSMALTNLINEQSAVILEDLLDKYNFAIASFKEKVTADETFWLAWDEKSVADVNELTATIEKNVRDVQEQLKLTNNQQESSLLYATQNIIDTLQENKSISNAERFRQFEQLQADIQLASKKQIDTLTKTSEIIKNQNGDNFITLKQNLDELQLTTLKQLDGAKVSIMQSVNDLNANTSEQHEKVLAQASKLHNIMVSIVEEQLHSLNQNVSELQQTTSQQLNKTKVSILESINDFSTQTSEQYENAVIQISGQHERVTAQALELNNNVVSEFTKQLHSLKQQQDDDNTELKKAMLTQIISVGNDVAQGFEQLETMTSTQSSKLQTTITDLQHQLLTDHEETVANIGQLQQQMKEVPELQHIHQLQNVLQQKMDEQLETSHNEWQAMKSQQIVQIGEAREFIKEQIAEQQRQSQQQESYFTSIKETISSVNTNLEQPLQKISKQLAQLEKVESTEHQVVQSKLQMITSNVNELNSGLLKQLAGVKTEISKNNLATVQQQLKSFETQLNQLKNAVTSSKSDITKQMQKVDQLVKKDGKSDPELQQILQSVNQIRNQFKEHEMFLSNRIDVIENQLLAMQQVSTSSIEIKSTSPVGSIKQLDNVGVKTKAQPVVEAKPKNGTEVIEDKANGITMHNKYVNGVLKQSDMLQNGKISYTAFYNEKGTLEKTVNFDKNGKRLTEMLYYPTGAVKERTEYSNVRGKQQKEVTKFSLEGKRLN